MANDTSWSDELQSALLTAENHGDAYRLLHHPDFCRAELRKVIAKHHPEVNDVEQETIAQAVLLQWLADKAESAEAKVSASTLLLVNRFAVLAYSNCLIATDYDVLADGTIHLRFGEGGCKFDRYASATIDDGGADIDVGGFIGDCPAGIQLQQLPLAKPLPRDFVIAASNILKD